MQNSHLDLLALKNQIEVKLAPDVPEITNDELWLEFMITIDGVSILADAEDCYDIIDFIKSAHISGRYFICTCSCGFAECAGYGDGIEVRIERNKTYWIDHDQDRIFLFDTNDMQAKGLKLAEEIKRWDIYARSKGAKMNIWPQWSREYLLTALRY